jgi:hypothetical protein
VGDCTVLLADASREEAPVGKFGAGACTRFAPCISVTCRCSPNPFNLLPRFDSEVFNPQDSELCQLLMMAAPYFESGDFGATGLPLAVLAFAQRAFCAAAILALAAALIFRRLGLAEGDVTTVFERGLPGPLLGAPISLSNAFACSRRAISESISPTMFSKLNFNSSRDVATGISYPITSTDVIVERPAPYPPWKLGTGKSCAKRFGNSPC